MYPYPPTSVKVEASVEDVKNELVVARNARRLGVKYPLI